MVPTTTVVQTAARHPLGTLVGLLLRVPPRRHAVAEGLITVGMTMPELTCPAAQPLARGQNDADRLSCGGRGSKIAPSGRALDGAV